MITTTVTADDAVSSGNSTVISIKDLNPIGVSLFCFVTSGTPTYSVQLTPDGTNFVDHVDLNTLTDDAHGNIAFPVRGIRVSVTSGSGTVDLVALQAES